MTTPYASTVLLAGAALILSACASKPPRIVVGSKNTTEQTIVGEIIAGHLEKQLPGVRIERRLGMGASAVVQGAMQSGDLDLYVEDVGTMLGTVLREEIPAEESLGLERARTQFQNLHRLTVLKPLGFHHQVVVVRSTSVKSTTLTAIADVGMTVRIGVAHELADRKDAFKVLTTKYRLTMRELPRQLDALAMYEALQAKTIDLAIGYASDAWVGEPGFELVKDDRNLLRSYPVCVVVSNRALGVAPPLQRVLEELSGRFADEKVHRLNLEVDLKHRSPAQVAREFMVAAGL